MKQGRTALAFDAATCEQVEFVTPGDVGQNHWPWTWPRGAMEAIERAVKNWQVDNRDATIRAVTVAGVTEAGAPDCALIIHFTRPARPRSVTSPAFQGSPGGRPGIPSSDARASPASMPTGDVRVHDGQSGRAAQLSFEGK